LRKGQRQQYKQTEAFHPGYLLELLAYVKSHVSRHSSLLGIGFRNRMHRDADYYGANKLSELVECLFSLSRTGTSSTTTHDSVVGVSTTSS
jgi:hypothetical protein